MLSPGIVLPPLASASAAYAHSSRPSAISALGTPLPPWPTRRPGERLRTAPCARQQPAPRCCRHPTSPRQRGGADGRATADATEPKWAMQARWPHDGTARQRARSVQTDAAPRSPRVGLHGRLLSARASSSTGINHIEGPKSLTTTQVGSQPSAGSSCEHPAAAARHAEHQVEAASGAAPQLAQRRPAHERSAARCQSTSQAQFL